MNEAPQEQLVNLVDPDTGEIGSLPASQARAAIQQGFTQATPEAVDNHFKEQKYGSTGQQIATGVEGAAEGLLGPLATGAEKLLSKAGVPGLSDEDIRGRKEINPVIHGAANIGTFAGSLFTGVGEAALLEKAGIKGAAMIGLDAEKIGHEAYAAAKAAGATSKAANLAREAAIAEEGIGTAGKIGSSAMRAATEMALYQSGDEVSKKIVNDPNQTLGSAMADIRNAGLFGLIGGGSIASVSPLWEATVGKSTGSFINDFKSRIQQHLDNPDPHAAVMDELNNYYHGTKSAADEVYGATGLKAQEVEKLMPEMSPKIADQTQVINNDISKSLESLGDDPFRPRLEKAVEKYQSLITHPEAGSSEIFNAAQDLKQQLQEWGKYNKNFVPLAEKEFRDTAKDLAYKIRTSLEDSEVWGKAAERQKAINSGFKEYLPALKDFEKKFTVEVGGEKIIDPGKVQTYLNQTGKASQEVKQKMLGNFLDAAEKYRKVIGDTHANLGISNPIEDFALNHVKQSLDKLSPGAALADVFVKKGASQVGGNAMGAAIGGVLGHFFGSGAIGAVVGEHALGPFLSSVLPGLVKPLLEKESSATGFKGAVEYGMSAARGDAAMGRAARGVFKGGARATLPIESDVKKLDKKLLALKEDPSPLINSAGTIGHYLPNHAVAIGKTAAEAVNYLNSLRPNTDKQMPLDAKMPPNPVKQASYERALQISQNPLIVMDNVKEGSVTPQDLATLQNVFPGFYSSMREKLTSEMINHISKDETVPYKTRLGLSMFLGQPLDSTMTPEGIMAAQPKAPQPQPQQGGMKPTQGGMQKLAKMGAESATPGQMRQMGKAKHLS